MHLKQKAYSFGLIYTIITVTLYFSAGRCEPTAPSVHPASPSALYDAGSSFVTTEIHIQPSISPTRRWLHLGSKRGDRRSGVLLLQTETFKNMVELKRDAPEPRLKPRTMSSRRTSSKTRFKRRQTERKRPFTSHGLLNGTCSLGHIEHTVPGKFYISGQFGPNLKNLGYHLGSEDSGQENQARGRGQQSSASHESWLRLEPTVECGENAMILTVRRKRATQLVLDRVNGSSLLFQLPPRCGYFIRITPKDLSLKAQYDACHVTQEDGSHVLPLLWRGIPVKVSCPVSKNKRPGEGPLLLCCSSWGMTLKLRGPSVDKEPRVNVRGEWTPLSLLANQCGFTVKKQDEEIIIFVPFDTCGVTVKDGNHVLSLQLRKETFILTCPIQPFEKLPVTNQPLADNPSFAKRAAESKLKSLRPSLWIPPFYLAPPNYPHPTYPQPKGHGSYNPSTPMAHGVAFSLKPTNQDYYYDLIPPQETLKPHRTHKPLSSKDQRKNSGRVYKKQNRKASDSNIFENSAATPGLKVQVDFQQPSGHDFSPYYHYYHLPKIPLLGTPQGPGPGASGRLTSSTSSQNSQYSSMSPNVSQFKDALNKVSPLIIPAPHTFPTSSKVSSLSASYPLQPFPYYYFLYLPDVAKSEAKRLVLLHPYSAAKTNPNPKLNILNMDTSVVSKLQDGSNGRLFVSVTPVVQSPVSQSSSHKPDPLSVPPLEQPFIPTPGFTHNADPYKYYYHPYYNNYLTYYVPEALRDKHLGAQITPRAAASSVKPSNHNHTPHAESMNDIQKRLLYHYSLYLPQLVKRNQKLHHHDGKKTKKAPTKFASLLSPPFDFGETQQTTSSVPLSMYNPLQSLYSYFVARQSLSEQSEQHGEKRAKEKLDKEMKDGTAGQIFDFAVPDSVADPSVVPPALSSWDSKRTCRLKKLTSHPDVYIVPLNGFGVNKRKINLMDVQGIKSHKDASSYSPGRSMVGCGSSPDFPGKLRFHMKDQPQPPSAVSVLLRIATDESFSSFYPKAHLPLSLMQNKPVYVELKLLEPSEPSMVLLVHSCLAYTPNPEGSWMRFYDGCSSREISQLLPSSDSRHIWRIKINGLPSLPSKRFPYRTHVGSWNPEDPEIYILCLTEVCSTVHNDCRIRCGKGPKSDAEAMK